VPFSPECHEAVAAVATDDPDMNGLVVEEVMTGFRSRDRVLRAAKVRVASFSPES
jgi:molecular chaperone GrpE